MVLRFYADLDDADIAELLRCRRASNSHADPAEGIAALEEVIEQ